jgi:hypothetical protein
VFVKFVGGVRAAIAYNGGGTSCYYTVCSYVKIMWCCNTMRNNGNHRFERNIKTPQNGLFKIWFWSDIFLVISGAKVNLHYLSISEHLA